MPIYEYHCKACGSDFEELTLSARESDVPACRRCGSQRVGRLLSAFAVHAAAAPAAIEAGPCGACGAPQRGMCAAE